MDGEGYDRTRMAVGYLLDPLGRGGQQSKMSPGGIFWLLSLGSLCFSPNGRLFACVSVALYRAPVAMTLNQRELE